MPACVPRKCSERNASLIIRSSIYMSPAKSFRLGIPYYSDSRSLSLLEPLGSSSQLLCLWWSFPFDWRLGWPCQLYGSHWRGTQEHPSWSGTQYNITSFSIYLALLWIKWLTLFCKIESTFQNFHLNSIATGAMWLLTHLQCGHKL